MIYERDDIEGIDSSILTNPLVLKYSGHEDTFSDPLQDCRDCNSRWRADHIEEGKCPNCGSENLTDPRPFNLMFKTAWGQLKMEVHLRTLDRKLLKIFLQILKM